jgi:putative ABC transport system permease protein
MLTLRIALRSLARTPGFTAVAILTLVLGIGALTAIFSAVNSVLLRPLAGFETERIVKLAEKFPGRGGYVRARTYREWQKLTDIFEEIGARQYANPNLSGMGEPEQLTAALVTASWFRVHRMQPFIGRTFAPDEDRVGAGQVAVLDYGFWQRRFGGDRSLIGRTITLDNKPCLIVGVMPQDFLPLGKGWGDLYLPWIIDANEMTGFEVIARLRPGMTMERAHAAIDTVQSRLARGAPQDYQGVLIDLQTLRETIVGQSRELLRLLLAGAAFVLLIACVNVANLFLARGAARRRDTEIRTFLGASRWQVIAPALMESAIVATIGGGLGLLAASGITRVLASRLDNFPRAEEIGVDGSVALAALVASLLTVLACGIAPAFAKWRLRRAVLVPVEVALTVVLLISSGLLIRSFAAMTRVDLGYQPAGVILGFIAQPEDPHDHRDGAVALWKRVRERIATLPDVASVATTTGTPTGGLSASFPIIREGEDVKEADRSDQPSASTVIASGEYFHVAGIRLLAGRTFDDRDSARTPHVAIVSQAVADRYFSGNALGRRIQLPTFDFNVSTVGKVALHEIVGVVSDVRQTSIRETARMSLYLPESQNAVRYTHIFARAKSADPMRLERLLRHALYLEAPALTIGQMLTLERGGDYLMRDSQRAMWLLTVFAALALALAAVGVHGVIAFAAAERRREMGIRVALGARPAHLFRIVTGDAVRLALAGAAMGIALAYFVSRLLATLLFGVGRADPVTYITGITLMIVLAAIASFTPALRAARTDPSITLRAE